MIALRDRNDIKISAMTLLLGLVLIFSSPIAKADSYGFTTGYIETAGFGLNGSFVINGYTSPGFNNVIFIDAYSLGRDYSHLDNASGYVNYYGTQQLNFYDQNLRENGSLSFVFSNQNNTFTLTSRNLLFFNDGLPYVRGDAVVNVYDNNTKAQTGSYTTNQLSLSLFAPGTSSGAGSSAGGAPAPELNAVLGILLACASFAFLRRKRSSRVEATTT